MIVNQKTLEKLSKKLSLPFTGKEQDWDIEMANPKRIKDFLHFYMTNDLSTNEKVALMSLIVASYDDFLEGNPYDDENNWSKISIILLSEKPIFKDLLDYWAMNKEKDPDNFFRVTPYIRTI